MSSYPWYAAVEESTIQQGDILQAVQLFVPPASIPAEESEIVFDWIERDVIVMSQTCDMVEGREKVPEVLLCSIWALDELSGHLATPSGREDARRGNLPGVHLLNACELPGFERRPSIVDFRRVHTVPVARFRSLATGAGRRLRLLPPYREHLSQSFARFFMRVGLPVDIPSFR